MSFAKANSYFFLQECYPHILADVHTSERGVTISFKHENARPGNLLIVDVEKLNNNMFLVHVELRENGNMTYDVTSQPLEASTINGVVIATANEVIPL